MADTDARTVQKMVLGDHRKPPSGGTDKSHAVVPTPGTPVAQSGSGPLAKAPPVAAKKASDAKDAAAKTPAPAPPPPSEAERQPQRAGETRSAAIYRVLVKGHQMKKSEDKEDLDKALQITHSPAPAPGGSTALTTGQKARKFGASLADKAVRAEDIVSNFDPLFEGALGIGEGASDIIDIVNARKEDGESTVGGDYGSGFNVANGLYTSLRGGLGTLAAARRFHKAKNANRLEKNIAGLDIASNAAGTVGGLANMSSGITGLAGGSGTLAGVFTGFGNAFDTIGSGLGLGKSTYQLQAYRSLKDDAGAMAFGAMGRKAANTDALKKAREKYAADGSKGDAAAKKLLAEQLRDARAQRKKDKATELVASAVGQTAGVKASAGGYGLLSNGLKLGGSMLGLGGAITKLAGAGFGGAVAGMLMKSIGAIAKTAGSSVELAVGKRAKTKQQTKNQALQDKTVQDYLTAKRAKVKDELKGKLKDGEASLTDAEADHVILMRMGVLTTTEVLDRPITEAQKGELFRAIIGKRADTIVNSPDKKTLLEGLGLMETAKKEDVMEAMGFA